MIVHLQQKQLERRAELLCNYRNQSLPAELGKASFEVIDHGVQFIWCHYKLDSTQCDYQSLVAKIIWQPESNQWELYAYDSDAAVGDEPWIPYPFLARSHDLTAMIREVEKDPKSYFWG
ncbi:MULTISPECIES: DUF3024 domain-containing protein [Vibrio]|uniref:DUF3024 domain-containing protein n=1 Tax=Vibrio chanodichtyis TaxID=3027932 RepID=A0ABT5UXF6_9VIBR|nr:MULTISPECIES: DUF3024 domain-containing protein [Vibrio]MDE1514024.1 DUF3024 domain-containing protein [Vibrio chanodichtyis]QIL86835.1 DUF3024 domain-containing protein [Vibrio sp. HDW18]